ncbi:MAG: tRNA (guanosine(46)-N7)-methyltransferase TrmB [Pseudomonadota bacterium]|nr:tRNA (guanosine(46)-N7)-methyltransferase TrmB [Pseudomonadota bacterium]
MSDVEESAPRHRRIRSFVRREGRMTEGQTRALAELWPHYGLETPTAVLHLPTLFGRDVPVIFEIGFGMGDYLASRLIAEPQHDFIGVEVHRPGVGRVMNHAQLAARENLRVACHDAVEVLRDWLPPGCLDEIVIQFPDPWHKKKHNKRRLVQPEFVQLAVSRLKPGGRLSLATDWAPYAEHMLLVLNAQAGLRNLSADGGYVPRPEARLKTKFEKRGERLGHAVFDLAYLKI